MPFTLFAVGPNLAIGCIGALLAGGGYALTYPGMALVAIERASAADRGAAVGIFSAFLDLSLGLSSPTMGAVAANAGLPTVFVIAAAPSLGLIPLSWRFLSANRH